MQTCITVWHLPNHDRWFDEGLRHTLAAVRAAGFTHVNWNPDAGYSYVYAPSEIDHIAAMLAAADLRAWSIHGSHGKNGLSEVGRPFAETRKDMLSPHDWQREAGLHLVRNRLDLAAAIGAPNVVMHVDLDETALRDPAQHAAFYDRLHRAFDALEPDCRRSGVPIAVENLTAAPMERSLEMFERLFARHGPEVAGLCYDSGHAQLVEPGRFRLLEAHAGRLVATHLHDNRSVRDDHLLPGDGNIDWPGLLARIAPTPCEAPMTFETPPSVYGMGYALGEHAFYARAHAVIARLEADLAALRGGGPA